MIYYNLDYVKSINNIINFNPGHVSHLIASYKQGEELGYESLYCVHPDFIEFLPEGSRICVYERNVISNAEFAIRRAN